MFIKQALYFNLFLKKNPAFTTKQNNYRTAEKIIARINAKPLSEATHSISRHSNLCLPSGAALANNVNVVSEAVINNRICR